MPSREEALAERFESALTRMGEYFMGSSPLPIAGALCLAAHGVVRATVDVDVLLTRDGLERFKQIWLGRGYKLIAVAKLPRDFGQALDPYVRSKYEELWQTAQQPEDDY